MPVFGFSKKRNKTGDLQMMDLQGNYLKEGDEVISHRYELGRCVIKMIDGEYFYESIESHETVSWLKMVDAVNRRQKVSKQ